MQTPEILHTGWYSLASRPSEAASWRSLLQQLLFVERCRCRTQRILSSGEWTTKNLRVRVLTTWCKVVLLIMGKKNNQLSICCRTLRPLPLTIFKQRYRALVNLAVYRPTFARLMSRWLCACPFMFVLSCPPFFFFGTLCGVFVPRAGPGRPRPCLFWPLPRGLRLPVLPGNYSAHPCTVLPRVRGR